MTTSLLNKLIVIIIVLISFADAAHAQIVYTDVKPDLTFSTNGSVYYIDLNKDGINDFKISYTKKYNCK